MEIAIVRGPRRIIIIEMSSTVLTQLQPNYKYVSCFASIICFSLLQSFSLSMFIFRTSSLIILLPALRQKTEIL